MKKEVYVRQEQTDDKGFHLILGTREFHEVSGETFVRTWRVGWGGENHL